MIHVFVVAIRNDWKEITAISAIGPTSSQFDLTANQTTISTEAFHISILLMTSSVWMLEERMNNHRPSLLIVGHPVPLLFVKLLLFWLSSPVHHWDNYPWHSALIIEGWCKISVQLLLWSDPECLTKKLRKIQGKNGQRWLISLNSM